MFKHSATTTRTDPLDRSRGASSKVIGKPWGRGAFTLLELLIVIAMIAVISVLTLGVLRGAQDDARTSATQALISQLNSILHQRHESYQVRKLGIQLNQVSGEVRRQIRQMVVADIIRIEMPRSSDDLVSFPGERFQIGLQRLVDQGLLSTRARQLIVDVLADARPALADRYSSGLSNAEYLYELVAATELSDFPAVDLISNAAIADVDRNGQYELVDAWGDPLVFAIEQQVASELEPLVWVDAYLDRMSPTTSETPLAAFQPLDPAIPRSTSQIRFTVRSINVDAPSRLNRLRPHRRPY